MKGVRWRTKQLITNQWIIEKKLKQIMSRDIFRSELSLCTEFFSFPFTLIEDMILLEHKIPNVEWNLQKILNYLMNHLTLNFFGGSTLKEYSNDSHGIITCKFSHKNVINVFEKLPKLTLSLTALRILPKKFKLKQHRLIISYAKATIYL
jgi:hypothetical protein